MTLNPFLMTLTIKIDGNPSRPTITNPNGDKFSRLRHIIFVSDSIDHNVTGVKLQWLAHKLTNRAILSVNTMNLHPRDTRVSHTFIKKMYDINILIMRWDQFEMLLSQCVDDNERRKRLKAITHLQITIASDTQTISSDWFDWLYIWAKSGTRREQTLLIIIEMYNRTVHDAITNSSTARIQPGIATQGLASLQVRVDDIDVTFFKYHVYNLDLDMVSNSAKFWPMLCKTDANVRINVNTRLNDHFLTFWWFESMALGCKQCNLELNMRLVLHFNIHHEPQFLTMFIPFESFVKSFASYMTGDAIMDQLRRTGPETEYTRVQDFVEALNLLDTLHVTFICPSRIPNIREEVLKNATNVSFGVFEALVLKHLILSGRLRIEQTEPSQTNQKKKTSGKRKSNEL
jgi:hypothetical protein